MPRYNLVIFDDSGPSMVHTITADSAADAVTELRDTYAWANHWPVSPVPAREDEPDYFLSRYDATDLHYREAFKIKSFVF